MRAGAVSLHRDPAREAATGRAECPARRRRADHCPRRRRTRSRAPRSASPSCAVPSRLIDWARRRAVGDASGRRVLHPRERPPARRAADARHQAALDSLRRALGRHPRVRARRRWRASPSRAATSCPRDRAATCSRPARCSCRTASRSSSTAPTRRGSRRAARSSTPTSPTAAIRAPRSAWRTARLLAVACDGRTRRDAGMTLGELARVHGRARRGVGDQPGWRRIGVARVRWRARQSSARRGWDPDPRRAADSDRSHVPARSPEAEHWTNGPLSGRRERVDTNRSMVPPLRERLGLSTAPDQPAAAVAEARPDTGPDGPFADVPVRAQRHAHAALAADRRAGGRRRPDRRHRRVRAAGSRCSCSSATTACRRGRSTCCWRAGTVLIEWTVWASGDSSSAYAMLFFWVAIYAFYFLPQWRAVLQLGADRAWPTPR